MQIFLEEAIPPRPSALKCLIWKSEGRHMRDSERGETVTEERQRRETNAKEADERQTYEKEEGR